MSKKSISLKNKNKSKLKYKIRLKPKTKKRKKRFKRKKKRQIIRIMKRKFRRRKRIIKRKGLKLSHFFTNVKPHRRLRIVKKYKTRLQKKENINLKELKNNRFIQHLLEGLNLFNKQQYNIYINLQRLNPGLSLHLTKDEKKFWKKKLLLLKRYSRMRIFKETLNIILISIKMRKSAQLVSDFLAQQISRLKRQSYFFLFFKRALNLFIKSPTSNIRGIKIVIKGRFNNAPRARKNIMTVGKIPIQTISQNINYSQSTAFSPNGTFGIKVWICEN